VSHLHSEVLELGQRVLQQLRSTCQPLPGRLLCACYMCTCAYNALCAHLVLPAKLASAALHADSALRCEYYSHMMCAAVVTNIAL
jgi:hypothetical protein